ncbi:hypothetical protein MOUN0_I08064 [Monosporozyma unispora]|nr:hypothetical protein C6P44_002675 [Kazachstania unispora]
MILKNLLKAALVLFISSSVIGHGRRFLGGNADFYTAQVGAGATITASLCAVTISTFNASTGIPCIIALAYTVFASVGQYITTGDVPDTTVTKRMVSLQNSNVTHANGTSIGLAGDNLFNWYHLTNTSDPSYIGNYIPEMKNDVDHSKIIDGYVGYAINKQFNLTTVSVTGGSLLDPQRHYDNRMAYYSGEVTTLEKRGWADKITWASYEYNHGNQDLWNQFPKEGDEFEMLASDFGQYVGNNVAQKYCACFGDSAEAGTQMALHGELYFDAYGGVDGDCDANLCNTY